MADSLQTEIAVARRLGQSALPLANTCDALLATAAPNGEHFAHNGERLAYVELCLRHREMVFRTVLRVTHNMDDAEDILQDSWMRGFAHIGTFDGRSEFSTWVTRIAINSALTMIRRRRTKQEYSLDDPSILVTAGLRKRQNHRETQKSAAWRQKEYGWFGKLSIGRLRSCGQQSKSAKCKMDP